MSWFSRLRNAVHPKRLDEELADEMRDHLDRRAAGLAQRGASPEEARHSALRRFGNSTLLREQSREIRLWSTLESVLQDTRHAWRGMRKSPVFAVTAILSLSLAIGANTAIFSIVDAAMLRPLPVPEPERLFTLASPGVTQPGSETPRESDGFSYPLYQQLRSAAGTTARLAAFGYSNQVEARVGGPTSALEALDRQFVSGDGFEIAGVSPALGRLFSPEDDRTPGGHPVAVLSHDYWRHRFAADPAILGRVLQIEGKSYSVIGVARDGFFGIEPGKFVDVWLPCMMYDNAAFTEPGWRWFRILGRLNHSTSREQLLARLQPIFHDFQVARAKRFATTMPHAVVKQFLALKLLVHPGSSGPSSFRTTFERPLWIVLGVAAGILVIACANVASLLLARSTARSAEMAMRISLGAGRGRLARQLLTESLLLSLLACGAGWLLAYWTAPALVSLLSQASDPVRFALALDSRVLLFCAAVSTLAAVGFGMQPAWQASATKPMLVLRGAASQGGRLRLGRFFVGLQVACAFCLVMAGAAFLFSLRNLFAVDTGFKPEGVTVLTINTDTESRKSVGKRQLMDQLQRRIAALPGMEGAALANVAIFKGENGWVQIVLPGQPPSVRDEFFYAVSRSYFSTLRTPLLSGRDFSHGDESANPEPVIVNRAFARRYFSDDAPLGREFGTSRQKKHFTVVGVVANTNFSNLRVGSEPVVYAPVGGGSSFSLYVRSQLDMGSVTRLVEREAQAIGSGMRVREIMPLQTLMGNTILREKLLAGIGGVFAVLGLLLAAIGLFGLLNYSVARRTKEIGIRAALGARRGEIVMLVAKDLFALVGAGLIVGLALSLAVMNVFQSMLFGVHPADPLVLGTAAAIFLTTAFIAGLWPARRAAGIDPMVALRHE